MKEIIELHLRATDLNELKASAKSCGLTLHTFLQEVIECKAAELRLARPEPEAPSVPSTH